MLLALTGAVGFGLYVRMTPQAAKVPPDLRREEEIKPIAPVARKNEPKAETPKSETRYLVATRAGASLRMTRLDKPLPDGEDPKAFVVRETVRRLGPDALQSKGVKLDGGTAILDFNATIRDGLGSAEEGELLKALQMTLGQFSDVDSIRIAADGQVLEEIGHTEVVEPLPVIRPIDSP
jgi:hypothetical protein